MPGTTTAGRFEVSSIAAKAGIGAGAGVCLAIVKLIEVNFYLGQPHAQVVGGILTALAFVALAALFSAFVSEKDPRKIFTQGLLAPSLLVALVHQGAAMPGATTTSSPESIPTLSGLVQLVEPTLYAEQRPGVQVVTPDRLRATVSDGALLMLGRGSVASSFMYVVGKTTRQEEATAVAERVQRVLTGARLSSRAQVIQIQGNPERYVIVGGLQTQAEATRIRREVITKVVDSGQTDPGALKLLVNGVIVDGRSLAQWRSGTREEGALP